VRRVGLMLAAVALLAACSGDPAPVAAPSPTTASPTPTPTPTPTAKPTPPPAVNPLTGLPGVPRHPVVAVKIDDTASGRPQIGLEDADLVYVEQVEAGATRLLAVFASRLPAVVGPVRSVRNSDPELLAAYGHPALAYSGGARAPVSRLRHSTVADAGPQRQGAGYRRLGSRSAPYNLVVNASRLAASLRGVSTPKDIGLRWSRTDPRTARAPKVVAVSVTVGTNRLDWRWDARSGRWQLHNRDGSLRRTASGRVLSTPNLVVPFSPARIDPTDVDVLGAPSVYTSTVGTGRLLLFRDGRVLGGTWARSRPAAGTSYLDAGRRPLTLAPGGAWVLLAATGAPVSYRRGT
jgi:Protein of unknown function (DUF3048) N-terminal domain/Protein of unknown function (DUF3048) C-terminal domain